MSKQGQGESKRSWNIISIALYDVLYLIPPDDTLIAFLKTLCQHEISKKFAMMCLKFCAKILNWYKKVLQNILFVEQLVRSGYLLTQITSSPCAVSGLPLQQYQSSHWISELLHNPSTSLTHYIVILYHTISKVSSFKEHLNLLFSWVHVQCKSVRA